VPEAALRRSVQRLSALYRPQHQGRQPIVSELDALAYAAVRMPATMAAVSSAFHQLCLALPDFAPQTVLDIGAGTGATAWAAASVFAGMPRVRAVEPNPKMRDMGIALSSSCPSSTVRSAAWQAAMEANAAGDRADLTVASYVLGELSTPDRDRIVRQLWECSADAVVIVEPGTPSGYGTVTEAGRVLSSLGAHILAPVPLSWPCLESSRDWLHFAARVSRTGIHRRLKSAELSHEDEKFSYLAASHRTGRLLAGRVVRHPEVRPGHLRLAVCTPSGFRRIVVSRRQGEAYRLAKRLRWGSGLSHEEARLLGLEEAATRER